MSAHYNEHDPQAASWLRELIKQGHIADGIVDERSIEDITPDELSGFTQCHFFAGIGVWSYALRQAGWPDDRPVWTGSCPCQAFSAAGKGTGFADERHLWPAWFHLIEQCRPPVIFGEQVEAAVRHGWLDLVQDDLEGSGYACGAVAFPSASVGAPHIRQRLYFAGHLVDSERERGRGRKLGCENAADVGVAREADELADATIIGRVEWRSGEAGHQSGSVERPDGLCDAGGMVNSSDKRHQRNAGDGRETQRRAQHTSEPDRRSSPTNGFWRNADWLHCTDGKWRPVEPGTFPLAHGSSARVGRLRGYGNAIVAPAAQAFIEEFMSL